MKFKDYEDVISADRMRRYVNACGGNVQKGMTLYRYNLALSGYAGSYGNYWSSSLNTDFPWYAYFMYFYSGDYFVSGSNRGRGFSVRPVTE